MFLKPYMIERRVTIGTTAKDVFSFNIHNLVSNSSSTTLGSVFLKAFGDLLV